MAAKDKDTKSLPEGQGEKVKKPSKLKRIVIILAILLIVLAGAGAGSYWWFFMRTPATGTENPEGTTDAPEAATTNAEGTSANPAGQAAPAGGEAAGGGRIERQTPLPRSGGQVLPLPPIKVNISGPSGQRYLKLGMEVEVNADVSAQLKASSARIRDAIIMLLAGKTLDDISSPDGKVLLKAEVAARLNQILGAQRIVRVYFTDFVIQ